MNYYQYFKQNHQKKRPFQTKVSDTRVDTSSSVIPVNTDQKSNEFPLVRALQNSGFVLGTKTGKVSEILSAIHCVYYFDTNSTLQRLRETIERKRIFGHILYIDAIQKSNQDIKRVVALHTFVNSLEQIEEMSYSMNNVIPRKGLANKNWISGLFIGKKKVKENWDYNNFEDKHFGGIVEINSNYEIPLEITDPVLKARTVGIYINSGARAVLKAEPLNVYDMTAEQLQTYRAMDLTEAPIASVLLQGGAFVWLEAVVELRVNESNTVLPIQQMLKNNNFASDLVPILVINKYHCNDWGIHVKPVIDGTDSERVVCIEGPNGWNKSLSISIWNELNIRKILYSNNFEPNWMKGSICLETKHKTLIVERKHKIEDWMQINVNFRTDMETIRLLSMNEFIKKDSLLLFCVKSDKKYQIIARIGDKEGKQPVSQTGPVITLLDNKPIDRMAFSLHQNHFYGTHLFAVKRGDNVEDMKLQAIICGKSSQTFEQKIIEVNDVLWKAFDSKTWFKGLLIGGIDVIRKKQKIKRVRKRKTNEKNGSESSDQTSGQTSGSKDIPIELLTITGKLKKPKDEKKRKNIVDKSKEIPQMYENWDNCIEITTDYVIPNKKKDLPFNGQIIGIYIPSGAKCLLINGPVFRDDIECQNIYQVFESHRTNPLLLQEKTFLWIEGRIEFNLLEDIDICYQPLDQTLLKQLVLEQHVIGSTDGIEENRDLFGKVLFLKPTTRPDILWSIEVSPLIYPAFENRVIYINIPIGGQIEVQNWDKAFEQTINIDHNCPPSYAFNSNEMAANLEPKVPLRQWIERDFNSKIYTFIEECVRIGILIRIPNKYRRNALKTRESLKRRDKNRVKNYSNVFFTYEHFKDNTIYWFVIRYKNLYLDHFGLMKFDKSKEQLFESMFKKDFYQQLI